MRLFLILTLLVPTLLLAGLALPGVGGSMGVNAPAPSSVESTQDADQQSCLECLAICRDTGDGSCERACGCTGTAIGVAQ